MYVGDKIRFGILGDKNMGELKLEDKGVREIKCVVSQFEFAFEFTNNYLNITEGGFLSKLEGFLNESQLNSLEFSSELTSSVPGLSHGLLFETEI